MALTPDVILGIMELLKPPEVSAEDFNEHIQENYSSFSQLINFFNSLDNKVDNNFDYLKSYTDLRINKLIASPIDENFSNDLNGKRIFAFEFWFLMGINEIEGLPDKFNLIETKITNTVKSVIGGEGIVFDSADPQNPRVVSNNPPNYYNKTTIDEKIQLINNQLNLAYQDITNLNSQSGGSLVIIDNLTSTDSDKSLSAKQGKVLKDLIDSEIQTRTNADTNLLAQIANLDSDLDLQIAELYTAIDSITININNLQTQINTINNTILNLDAIL
jgi:hypothetical protein